MTFSASQPPRTTPESRTVVLGDPVVHDTCQRPHWSDRPQWACAHVTPSRTATSPCGPQAPLPLTLGGRACVCLPSSASRTLRLRRLPGVWGERAAGVLTTRRLLLGCTERRTARAGERGGLVLQMFEVALPHPPRVRVPAGRRGRDCRHCRKDAQPRPSAHAFPAPGAVPRALCAFLDSAVGFCRQRPRPDEAPAEAQQRVGSRPSDPRVECGCTGWSGGPRKTCPPSTCGCDLIWKQHLCRCD